MDPSGPAISDLPSWTFLDLKILNFVQFLLQLLRPPCQTLKPPIINIPIPPYLLDPLLSQTFIGPPKDLKNTTILHLFLKT